MLQFVYFVKTRIEFSSSLKGATMNDNVNYDTHILKEFLSFSFSLNLHQFMWHRSRMQISLAQTVQQQLLSIKQTDIIIIHINYPFLYGKYLDGWLVLKIYHFKLHVYLHLHSPEHLEKQNWIGITQKVLHQVSEMDVQENIYSHLMPTE